MPTFLICDHCGGNCWSTKGHRALLSDPPIYIDEYICSTCGAVKEVTRERIMPKLEKVSIGEGDIVKDGKKQVKTDAMTFDINSGVYSDIYFKPDPDTTLSSDTVWKPKEKK